MLVPEVAGGAAPELDGLRQACDSALRGLQDAGATSLVVVGAGPSVTSGHRPVTASFAPFGTPFGLTLDRATAWAPAQLPISLLIAAWLLRQSSVDPYAGISLHTVRHDLTPAQCARWRPDQDGHVGKAFDVTQPWALLAMGDGSARRSQKAPGYYDPRAEAFDAAAATALEGADSEALLGIDADLATQLWCAGRTAWQVLAGLIAADGRAWSGELRYDEAPYGVGYFVASLAPSS